MHKATGADATGALAEGSSAHAEPGTENAVTAGPGTDRTPGVDGHRGPLEGFSVDELTEDFRLSCVSRALDDREILLQKQSRVFFQISGAGHEILLVSLARSLRPAYDWFFPYYRDRALVLALG